MTTAYRHWEILERSQTGPFMDEDDFLPKHFTPTLKKLIKKYEIKYDPAHPVPAEKHDAETMEHREGRGLVLMKNFMDEVRFTQEGNEVTMVMRATST